MYSMTMKGPPRLADVVDFVTTCGRTRRACAASDSRVNPRGARIGRHVREEHLDREFAAEHGVGRGRSRPSALADFEGSRNGQENSPFCRADPERRQPTPCPSPSLPPARSWGRIAPPGRSQPSDPAAVDRDHLRDQRPRLGPRRRDEPVGRLRLRQARRHLRQDPRPLLPGDDARPARRSGRSRCCCRVAPTGRRLLARSVLRSGATGVIRQLAAGNYALDPKLSIQSDPAAGRSSFRARSSSSPGKSPLWLRTPTAARSLSRTGRTLGDQLGLASSRTSAASSPARCRMTGRSRR